MTFADQMSDYRGRCQPHLARLRMLAHAEAGTALPAQVTAEVRDATNALIAEAEAAGRSAVAAMAGNRRQTEARTFIWVRLARLTRAADEAIDAARNGDVPGLRRHLARFSALTAAIWTVQQAVFVPASSPPAAPPDVPYDVAV